jgi:hypothetical protein
MDFDKVLKKHRDLYLFATDEGRVMFSLLDYESYKAVRYIMQAYPEFKFDLEDRVWDDCVVEHSFTNGKDYLDAGLITTTAQLILYLSCPQSIDSVNIQLEDARELLVDAREQAIITICEAFPSYLPETLEKMTWPILVRRLAQAEFILKREFEFQTPASHPADGSGRIFDRLQEYTDTAVDFSKVNANLREEEFGAPAGDFSKRQN